MKKPLLFTLLFLVIVCLWQYLCLFLVFGTSERCIGETVIYSGHNSVENKNSEGTIKNQPFNGEQIQYTQVEWPRYPGLIFFDLLAVFACAVVVVFLIWIHLRLQTRT
jgi:hypothetical protein